MDATVDGRRARRERGRAAVIDAMLELMDEGVVPPSSEDIAARACVSESSLFRYFDGIDDLVRETVDRFVARVTPRLERVDPGDRPLEARIAALVDARLELYGEIAGTARMARYRAVDLPEIATSLAAMRDRYAAQVGHQFAPELGRLSPARADDVAALLDSLLSFEAWEQLRDVHGRSRAQVRRAWTLALTRLLTD